MKRGHSCVIGCNVERDAVVALAVSRGRFCPGHRTSAELALGAIKVVYLRRTLSSYVIILHKMYKTSMYGSSSCISVCIASAFL